MSYPYPHAVVQPTRIPAEINKCILDFSHPHLHEKNRCSVSVRNTSVHVEKRVYTPLCAIGGIHPFDFLNESAYLRAEKKRPFRVVRCAAKGTPRNPKDSKRLPPQNTV